MQVDDFHGSWFTHGTAAAAYPVASRSGAVRRDEDADMASCGASSTHPSRTPWFIRADNARTHSETSLRT